MKRIDSLQNVRYKQWKKLKDKKHRDKTGLLLVEGLVVIDEIVDLAVVREIIVDEAQLREVDEYLKRWHIETTVLKHELFTKLQATRQSQGVIAVCHHFIRRIEDMPKKGRFLYMDHIQDPGNLGGMIRSAEAFSFDGVLIAEGSVDVANDKAIRASMASAFRIPIALVSDDDLLMHKTHCRFYALDLKETPLNSKTKFPEDLVLVVGNEAHGVRDEIRQLVDEALTISMKETIDSLNANVAASIAMFVIKGGKND